jgi:hypothetical protein
MFKNQNNLKIALLTMAIVLPTAFGLLCNRLNLVPGNSEDPQIFGTALLPQSLTNTSGLTLFAIILICALFIITAILAVIALSRRVTGKGSSK